MELQSEHLIHCPYCGEAIWMEVDLTAGDTQEFIEDCEVCCQPILYRAQRNPETESVYLRAFRQDE